ncbi:MAG: vWA domain-containing protein [Deltaproteobacteria bacterium]
MSRPIRERINLGLAAAACAALWAAAFGCSSGAPQGTSPVDGVGCDPAVDAVCGAVGAGCQSDAQCASGSCSSGACVSLGPSGGGGSSGTDELFPADELKDNGPHEDPTCVDLDVDFARVTPTVMLLIDQSGSMDQSFENGKDRWQTLRETLTDPTNSLLKKLETSVRFGMTLYTSDGGFGTGPTRRTCPKLQSVGIGLGNFATMSSFLNQKNGANYVYGPAGDTPTAESVDAVVGTLNAYQEEGPKSIILATDGDPDTCQDPNANDSDASKTLSVTAVQHAYEAGIPTHIISVGNQVTASHLKALAVAGKGGDATAQAYTALDTSALVAAFDAIIGSVRTCDFTLEGTVTASNAPRGKVVLDGQALTFGDANGWEMPDEQTVRLRGSACEQAQADAAGISMKFPCDAIKIGPR